MEDREFFDLLYQRFTKTTDAEDSYWMYEEELDPVLDVRVFNIFAVPSEEDRTFVGSVDSEEDAEFITAVHGCFPDLVRRLHDAVDESDRLDEERDNQEVRIADLIGEVRDLEDLVSQLKLERGE
ncbi:hypothetical protein [Mycobacteroides salmoniphilum]|uniref:hypothetical protein n=1 Tax=Mycobacteroides salmoniphilum TaxID=404941 RepID=UPI000992563E|nr:hypothetical protein [Mycobacteroides salmoniphilum]